MNHIMIHPLPEVKGISSYTIGAADMFPGSARDGPGLKRSCALDGAGA